MVNEGEFHSKVPLAVELRHIHKRFGDCEANGDIDLQVTSGSIHGVIGENGAGKSTAMKILYGIYPPTSGQILVGGSEVHWKSPKDAIKAGIGMVHQHFMLAGPYSALDNIILSSGPTVFKGLPRSLNLLDRKKALQKLQELSLKYSLKVDFEQKVEHLPVGIQQRIEILKLLYHEAKILILDEPTAVLTPQETVELFINLKKMRNEGKTIIMITHKLKEVMELTDRITVFRDGRVTGNLLTSETNEQELANLMVGRKVLLKVDHPLTKETPGTLQNQTPVLEIENLTIPKQFLGVGEVSKGKKCLDQVNLQVRPGEVVGIAGVEGNGQSELIKAIMGLGTVSRRGVQGTLRLFGTIINSLGPGQIRNLGIGVIPEDRQKEALLLNQPLLDNFLLGHQRNPLFKRFGFLLWKKARQATENLMEEFDVRPRNIKISACHFSGGNQQKFIIGREFFHQPKFLICAQPTRGVDVGAIEFIHQRILRIKNQGAGVLLISSELEEIMNLSDRIIVLYEGKIVAQFRRDECDEKTLGFFMGGGKKVPATPGPPESEVSANRPLH